MRNAKAWVATAAAALMLAGCKQEPSPFVGTWTSPATSAQYRLSEGGECRYINSDGLGQNCEWERVKNTDVQKIRIRIGEGRFFVEAESILAGGELMTFWPNKMDTFLPE